MDFLANSTKTKIMLAAIVVLAAFLRIWRLGEVPPTASLDEASIGYNAYSVVKIGVDEYGQFPFLSQRGYDDYRRSTYLFLVTPFVWALGLTAVAVRLPAVILGILTIYATYFLVLLLFSKETPVAKGTALFASLSLAISPWHVYISRLGHESNATLSFLVFGILFFLKGLKEKRFVSVALVFFILSTISYYSGQVLIPALLAGLAVIYRENLLRILQKSKAMRVVFILFFLVLIPIFANIFSPAAMIRFAGTSTFRPDAHWELYQKRVFLWNAAAAKKDIVGEILYNRRFFPIQVFLEGYFSHFKPSWLFTNSGGEPFKIPRTGLLYVWEIPLIILGILAFLMSRETSSKAKWLVLLWFFLAPLPGAIATQAPHAMRSYNFLPTWQIFSSFGLVYTLNALKKLKLAGIIFLSIVIVLSLARLYENYFTVFPKEQSKSFQYALAKAVPFVLSNQERYQEIIFSNKDNLYQSYMFVLFYGQYDPRTYVSGGGTKSGGFAQTHKFNTYVFRPINWQEDRKLKNTLFVGNPSDFPPSVSPIKVFYYLDGLPGVVLVENQ